jgi:hypothetical protein
MPNQATHKLQLKFHGRVIDHLGIQMYQSPVAAIAELVANAWDADAENVQISLPEVGDEGSVIQIEDDGLGMTLRQCEERYLNVGWCRRGDKPEERSAEKCRYVLGRKGIGKFAGFGIAEVIRVDTTSKETGERTVFELNVNKLRSGEYVSVERVEIPVLEYQDPSEAPKAKHGTTITLKTLLLLRRPSASQFARSMARKFLLHQRQADFKITVNDDPLPDSVDFAAIQYVFPRDYVNGEKPPGLREIDEGGWGAETIGSRTIRWRFLFHRETIDEEELRGIGVFTNGKLAQSPFLFNLTGGLGGQHGVEYLSGQVEADYLDTQPADLIAPERQRINWEHPESEPLLEWGQQRVRQLLRIWRERRGSDRVKELEKKVSGFAGRLGKLQPHESRTVKGALTKLAQVPTLNKQQFDELGDAVLSAWERGRLRELIDRISQSEALSPEELVSILVEAQVLTALNMAEAVKTRLLTIGGLKLRIQRRELETAVRDYISKNPWLISPQWETFRVEKSVQNFAKEMASQAELVGEKWEGRVDLALASGIQLLIIEFMRPGLRLDWEHIQRFERYVRLIRTNVEANTAGQFKIVTGYIVADGIEADPVNLGKIKSLKNEDMHALDWETLLSHALAEWREFLEALADRAPSDERLRVLTEEGTAVSDAVSATSDG